MWCSTPSPLANDPLQTAQRKVDQVASEMRLTIDAAVARGNQLDELDGKSIELERQSKLYLNQATTLKRKMRCQSYTTCLILVLILAVALIIVLAVSGAFN